MIIWGAVLFPVTAILFLVLYFRHRLVWFEYGLLFGIPLVLIGAAKAITEAVQTSDTEYWGGYVVRAEYHEDWDERVSCRHPKYRTETRTRTVTRNGRTTTETYTVRVQDGWMHAYDVDYHPPEWHAKSTIGDFRIDSGTFERLCQKFGNRHFVELNRRFHSDDGDMYQTTYAMEPEKIEPVTVSRSYTNRVQASESVFNFRPVDPAKTPVHDYPAITGLYDQRSVIGDAGPTAAAGEKKLQYWNAVLGSKKQVRLYVLVWRDQPMEVALDQESHWKGGNKNEFVTCIGIDAETRVQWCYVFSWTPVELLKVEARNAIMNQKELDLGAYADWLGPAIDGQWQRKEFKDFNYLTVEPPAGAIALVYILTLLVTIGLSIWSVMNEVEPDNVEAPAPVVRPGLARISAFFKRLFTKPHRKGAPS